MNKKQERYAWLGLSSIFCIASIVVLLWGIDHSKWFFFFAWLSIVVAWFCESLANHISHTAIKRDIKDELGKMKEEAEQDKERTESDIIKMIPDVSRENRIFWKGKKPKK